MEDNQGTIQEPTKKRTISPNFRKLPGTLAKKTQKALELVNNTNIDPKEALTLVNNGKIPCRESLNNFKKNLDKYRLSHPRMVKLARNVVLDTLKGESREVTQQYFSKTKGEMVEITEQIVPSVTNQLAAAAMVYDRADPIEHRNINLNLNADLSPIDLDKWRNR
jgi:hypothetical protein